MHWPDSANLQHLGSLDRHHRLFGECLCRRILHGNMFPGYHQMQWTAQASLHVIGHLADRHRVHEQRLRRRFMRRVVHTQFKAMQRRSAATLLHERNLE